MAPDLTTVSGKTYKQARVFRVEPDGINYAFAGGIVKIAFEDLPATVQNQYGYDPAKAKAFTDQDAVAQAQAAAEGAQALRAAQQRERQVQIANAKDVSADKKKQQEEADRLHWKQKLGAQGEHIKAKVQRMFDDGALVSYRVRIGLYNWPSDDRDDWIYIRGIPMNVADGDTWEGDVFPSGTFQPTGAGGTTYHEFCVSLDQAAAMQVHD